MFWNWPVRFRTGTEYSGEPEQLSNQWQTNINSKIGKKISFFLKKVSRKFGFWEDLVQL